MLPDEAIPGRETLIFDLGNKFRAQPVHLPGLAWGSDGCEWAPFSLDRLQLWQDARDLIAPESSPDATDVYELPTAVDAGDQ